MWRSDAVSGGGGGAAAMYTLHSTLVKAGIDSKILCEVKKTASPEVFVLPHGNILEPIIRRITSRLGLCDIHKISSFGIKRLDLYKEADLLNFHGTHGSFLSYLALPTLTKDKPSVFSFHDMWCLTGHCAYSYDCGRWETGCGKCPYKETYPAIKMDNTRLEWKLKKWVFNRSNLHIVCPSRWLADIAKRSLLKHLPIHFIPYGINCEVLRPLDSEKYRPLIEIPQDKKVIMFAATSIKDERKGGDLLMQALLGLPAKMKSNIVLLILGNKGEGIEAEVGIKTINLGFIPSERLRAVAYSVADIFVLPTRADNIPLVIHESIACGTPVLSFDVGGVSDIVRPGITGYLAEPEDVDGLLKGIIELLEDDGLRDEMGKKCREIALNEYTLELQAERYTELYRQVIETK